MHILKNSASYFDVHNTRPKLALGWQFAIACMINILSLSLPIMMLQVYDRIIPHQAFGTLTMLLIGVLTALTLDATLRIGRAYLAGWKAASQEHIAGCAAIDRFAQVDLPAFEKHSTGTHLQNMNALSRLREFYSGQALMALVDLPFVVLFFCLIGYLGGYLVLVPISLLAAFVMMAFFVGDQLKETLEMRRQEDDKKSSFIVSILVGMHTVKSLAMESLMMRRFEQFQSSSTQTSYQVAMATGNTTILSAVFGQLSLILTASFGILFVMNGSLSVGGLSACTLLAGRTIQPIQRVLGAWLRLQDLSVSREQAVVLFQMPVQLRTPSPVKPVQGNVSLQNISFAYDTDLPDVLNDVSLDIQSGEVVAISGEKGGGKSTLLQLIAGTLTPTAGRVTLDGMTPSHYEMADLVSAVGYLPQHGTIFRGTLMENIAGFDADHLRIAQAKDAAAILGLDEIINILPRGYETQLTDSQSDPVPPGVKQRIALTRILMHQPAILLFDDADRALDKDGYNMLFQLMGRLKGKTTLVMVSHDMNLLSFADRFFRLENGGLTLDTPNKTQSLSFLTHSLRGQ